jgi:flagellar protein FliO/FliZ
MSIPHFRKAATAAAGLLLALPGYAYAAPAATGEDTPHNLPSSDPQPLSSGGGGGSLVRTFVGLAIVIAVIYGVAWVLRHLKRSREERTRGTGLSTEAVVPLGPGRSLHLVRAGRELVLVGVAEHGVVPIRTYTEDEARRLGLLDGFDDEDPPPTGGDGRRPPTISAFLDTLRDRTAR